MIYLAAFLFTGVIVGCIVWFICGCVEGAFDLEDQL